MRAKHPAQNKLGTLGGRELVGEELLTSAPALSAKATYVQELGDGVHEPCAGTELPGGHAPIERGAQVVVLSVEDGQPRRRCRRPIPRSARSPIRRKRTGGGPSVGRSSPAPASSSAANALIVSSSR